MCRRKQMAAPAEEAAEHLGSFMAQGTLHYSAHPLLPRSPRRPHPVPSSASSYDLHPRWPVLTHPSPTCGPSPLTASPLMFTLLHFPLHPFSLNCSFYKHLLDVLHPTIYICPVSELYSFQWLLRLIKVFPYTKTGDYTHLCYIILYQGFTSFI